MHARIENDVIVEYPIYDLPSRLGVNLYGDLTQSQNVPEGFVYVQLEDRQAYDYKTQRLEYGVPYKKDDKWFGPWVIQELTLEEQEALFQLEATIQRNIRNVRLAESDWTQLPDCNVDKSKWALYRQSLRDISTQENFPFSVNWPEL